MSLTLGTLHAQFIKILKFVEFDIHERCIALYLNLDFGNSLCRRLGFLFRGNTWISELVFK